MNISNNIRFQSTEEKIEQALLRLLKKKKYDNIFVKDICIEAGINRSSFYSHYLDINDLMMKYEHKITKHISSLFSKSDFGNEDFITFFKFVKDNRVFYSAFLKTNPTDTFMQDAFLNPIYKNLEKMSFEKKLNYTKEEMNYHVAFFGAGLKALCAIWLQKDCKESPEQIAEILKKEYGNGKFIQ